MPQKETYVHVCEEPRHRNCFENEVARVYDVLISPNDQTLYHKHDEDTLYFSINPAKTEDQEWDCDDVNHFDVPPGVSFCRPHRTEPLIHQVRNVGDTDMRLISVEVKKSPEVTSKGVLDVPYHDLRWETKRLRVYNFRLAPGEAAEDLTYNFSGLSVFFTRSYVEVEQDRGAHTYSTTPGGFIWHDGPTQQTIRNVGDTDFYAMVAEWL